MRNPFSYECALLFIGSLERSVKVEHAVIIVGASKTGKSTIINALKRLPIYVATPRSAHGKHRRKLEPTLAVLGTPVLGSMIGVGKESMTLVVSPCVVETSDDIYPQLLLLDIPGTFDSRGPLVEVINTISIAKCMACFKTLRFAVMVKEDLLDGTAEVFANTAATMTQLFSKAGGRSVVRP